MIYEIPFENARNDAAPNTAGRNPASSAPQIHTSGGSFGSSASVPGLSASGNGSRGTSGAGSGSGKGSGSGNDGKDKGGGGSGAAGGGGSGGGSGGSGGADNGNAAPTRQGVSAGHGGSAPLTAGILAAVIVLVGLYVGLPASRAQA